MMNIEEQLAEKYKYKPLNKELSEKYRNIYLNNIPTFLNINGSNIKLYTLNGTKICSSYERIVIGDYGAFIEIKPSNFITKPIVKKGQEFRINNPKFPHIKYWWYTIDDGSNIKIYYQRKTVKYADYKENLCYISVYEVKI